MDNEQIVNNEEQIDYIQVINDLKANSVDKKSYNKLVDENKRLLDTLVNGGQIEQEKEVVDKDQLRKDLYGGGPSLFNVDWWNNTIKLREAIINEGGDDPFLAHGSKVMATEEDIASANRVVLGIQHCLDVAQGDNLVFTNELQRILVDNMPIVRRKK